MHKKIIIATIDTETCGLKPNNLVYDIGLVIHDKRGNVLAKYTALVKEIFTDAEKMTSAYYAKKLFTHYAPMLERGDIKIKPWRIICAEVQALITEHDVSVIAAYNLKFDRDALTKTGQQLGSSLLPRRSGGYKMLDIWLFACLTKLRQKTYSALARTMGWASNKGNIKTTAEHAFRYISGKYDFDEDHTALSDAEIEVIILRECFRQKKQIPYNIIERSPWKHAQA